MPLIVGEIVEIEILANSQNLNLCKVRVSEEVEADEEALLAIVTNAKNVKVGMRVVVASVGTVVDDQVVEAKLISGKKSFGMLCDSRACGWGSTNPGLAVSLPESGFPLGSEAPSQNPRSGSNNQSVDGENTIKQKKDAEKAARKAAVKEKRAAKKGEKLQ